MALLVACGEERDIEVWSRGVIGSARPLASRLEPDTMTLTRATEVVRDGEGQVEEIVPGCVTGESGAEEVVQVVPQAGTCDQFALIARSTGTAVLVFRKGDLTREMTIRVEP